MKTLIFILILLAFLQTTIIPLELVLVVLILRAYIVGGRENLWLGFGLGLLISFLLNHPLGYDSFIYLSLIELATLLRKTPMLGHLLVIVPMVFIFLTLAMLANNLFLQQSIIWPGIILASILAFPIYIALHFWEERFIIKEQIKLKV